MKTTKEERSADKLVQAISDIALDLDMVAFYLGRGYPIIIQDRLNQVIYRADTERQLQDEQFNNYF